MSNFDGLTRELVMPLAEGDEKFKEHITASKKQARKELMKIIRQAREEMGRLILQSEPRMKACFRSIGTAKWRSEEMLKAVVIENIHVQLNAIAEWKTRKKRSGEHVSCALTAQASLWIHLAAMCCI